MVMASRPEVHTASAAIAAVDMVGLAQQSINALVRVPFRQPWRGTGSLMGNLGKSVTREVVRTFMGYSSSLPIEEFRSVELVLDELCRVVMPPVVAALAVDTEREVIGEVPGIWYRPRHREPTGTMLYLHGGGYIGTSPNMYAYFTAELARATGCEIFVADYRLAPEFPFPAGVEDAVAVMQMLLDRGVAPSRLFVGGDSGGGGLANSLMFFAHHRKLPRPAGLILFSPEVDLRLDEPSITENASSDILPWNIPTASYLHGFDASSEYVSPAEGDLHSFPPTFVTWGGQEMFRDPIRRFVARLEEGGVDHVAMEEPSVYHVFPILMPWADSSRRVYREVAAFVRDRIELAPVDEVRSSPADR